MKNFPGRVSADVERSDRVEAGSPVAGNDAGSRNHLSGSPNIREKL
jgi:hypothetical protein